MKLIITKYVKDIESGKKKELKFKTQNEIDEYFGVHVKTGDTILKRNGKLYHYSIDNPSVIMPLCQFTGYKIEISKQ